MTLEITIPDLWLVVLSTILVVLAFNLALYLRKRLSKLYRDYRDDPINW